MDEKIDEIRKLCKDKYYDIFLSDVLQAICRKGFRFIVTEKNPFLYIVTRDGEIFGEFEWLYNIPFLQDQSKDTIDTIHQLLTQG